jgi:anthranilate phosphoribosyltransferase
VLAGEPGPTRDVVLLNTAAALVAAEAVANFEEGIVQAAASIDSGRAATAMDDFIALTQEFAAVRELAVT